MHLRLPATGEDAEAAMLALAATLFCTQPVFDQHSSVSAING